MVCDKVVCDKDRVIKLCVTKLWCDKAVCESWHVTIVTKMVCERWCVTKMVCDKAVCVCVKDACDKVVWEKVVV